MKETCLGCSDLATCTGPCEKIKNQIEEVFDVKAPLRSEIPFSNTKLAMKKKDDDEKDEPSIDDFREIDPGALYAADTDRAVIWDKKETIQGTASHDESDPDTLKKINECIQSVVPDIKLRRRYRAYLGCDKMATIAERAGVTKQSVQKQFERITKEISEMLKKRYNETTILNTPFKIKKAGGACRIELKK